MDIYEIVVGLLGAGWMVWFFVLYFRIGRSEDPDILTIHTIKPKSVKGYMVYFSIALVLALWIANPDYTSLCVLGLLYLVLVAVTLHCFPPENEPFKIERIERNAAYKQQSCLVDGQGHEFFLTDAGTGEPIGSIARSDLEILIRSWYEMEDEVNDITILAADFQDVFPGLSREAKATVKRACEKQGFATLRWIAVGSHSADNSQSGSEQ